jgi:hypothetical protein
MTIVELMGGHSYESARGTKNHVWKRELTYLARGRLDGRPFGKTLGLKIAAAVARRELIQLGAEVAYRLRPRQMGVPHG